MTALYENIPVELRALQQWINWRYETVIDKDGNQRITKTPVKPIDGFPASVTDPRHWTTFEKAVAKSYDKDGIGFVFTSGDDYFGCDLDNPRGNIEKLAQQTEIFNKLQTYTEWSPSGLGLHIIGKGKLPGRGKRQQSIELYDTERYFTFTGNVYRSLPIQNCNGALTEVYNSLGPSTQIVPVSIDATTPETLTDMQVIEHAQNAANGDKFFRLWVGDWQTDYGNQSQSEADFALINIIAFYSRNQSQTYRIFRESGLGRRVKANRGNYVMKMVSRAFDRMPRFETVMPTSGPWFKASDWEPWQGKRLADGDLGPLEAVATFGPADLGAKPASLPAVPATPAMISFASFDAPREFDAPVPPIALPGLLGRLVQHTWDASVHQIAEASIASGLSTMSLLASRLYRHGSLGLPLYLLLLAQTGTGKSFAYSANDARFNALLNYYRSLDGPKATHGKLRAAKLENMVKGEIGSAQGLKHHIAEAPSLLLQLDEYVDQIRMMAYPNCQPSLAQIKTELLKLVECAGPGRVYKGSLYSKRNTTATEPVDVFSASLSILATGTPEQFYNYLTNELLTSGFLPRFIILEYKGRLTEKNPNVMSYVPQDITNDMAYIFDRQMNLAPHIVGTNDQFIDVQSVDQATAKAFEEFDRYCLRQLQQANDEGSNMAGIWSRVKEHVRQIASLIAIGVNPDVPRIELAYIDMATEIVMPTVGKITGKVTTGDVGDGDSKLMSEIMRNVQRMRFEGWRTFRTHSGCKQELMDNGRFQISILRNVCTHLTAFKKHKLGSNYAFDAALRTLVSDGLLVKVFVDGVACVL